MQTEPNNEAPASARRELDDEALDAVSGGKTVVIENAIGSAGKDPLEAAKRSNPFAEK